MTSARAASCQGCAKAPYSDRTLLVRRPSDLRALLRSGGRIERIVLDEPLLPSRDAREAIAARLLELSEECGCVAGGIAFFAMLLVCVASVALGWLPVSLSSLTYAFAACVGGSVVGKLIKLTLSRWRLRREIRRLMLLWE